MFNNIEVVTFASVFHGIRFKVRRLFVGMTSNFFLYLPEGIIDIRLMSIFRE